NPEKERHQEWTDVYGPGRRKRVGLRTYWHADRHAVRHKKRRLHPWPDVTGWSKSAAASPEERFGGAHNYWRRPGRADEGWESERRYERNALSGRRKECRSRSSHERRLRRRNWLQPHLPS